MTLPLLFQFAKRNEKVMPPCMYEILHPSPLSLVVIFSYAPSHFPNPPRPPPPGNYCTVPYIFI